MSIREVLSTNLKIQMERSGVTTQAALAKLSGVSQAQIGNVLRCKRGASIDLIEKLANGLGCDPWLLIAPTGFLKTGHKTEVEPLVQCFLGLREDDQDAIWRMTHQIYAATRGSELL